MTVNRLSCNFRFNSKSVRLRVLLLTKFVIFTAILAFTLQITRRLERLWIIGAASTRVVIVDNASLGWLRLSNMLLCFGGGFELSLAHTGSNLKIAIAGCALVVIGLFLRICAIRTLGTCWSFHVAKFVGQPVIKHGIYRYLSHPAYVGNVWILGVFLACGAFVKAGFAAAVALTISIYQINVERSYHLCR